MRERARQAAACPTTTTTTSCRPPQREQKLGEKLSSTEAQTASQSSPPLREARTLQSIHVRHRRVQILVPSFTRPAAPDPPLAPLPAHSQNVRQFLGEDTPNVTPPSIQSRTTSESRRSPFASEPDPSVWSEDQQRQLMNALMGAAGGSSSLPGMQPQSTESPLEGNPLAALMAMMPQAGGQGGAGMPPGMAPPNMNMFGQPPALPAKKTLLQKLMPLVHLIAGWMLLTYFVLWKEPQVFEAQPHTSASSGSAWRRWGELGWRRPEDVWGVQFVVRSTHSLQYLRTNTIS